MSVSSNPRWCAWQYKDRIDLGFTDRVAIVTGSSRGIGRAAALLLGKEGARVIVTYHEQRVRAEAVVSAIEACGGEALAAPLDLCSIDSIHGVARSAIERWGRIDILINNAIRWSDRLPAQMPAFENIPPDEWRAFLGTNIEGPYAAIQSVLPSM